GPVEFLAVLRVVRGDEEQHLGAADCAAESGRILVGGQDRARLREFGGAVKVTDNEPLRKAQPCQLGGYFAADGSGRPSRRDNTFRSQILTHSVYLRQTVPDVH